MPGKSHARKTCVRDRVYDDSEPYRRRERTEKENFSFFRTPQTITLAVTSTYVYRTFKAHASREKVFLHFSRLNVIVCFFLNFFGGIFFRSVRHLLSFATDNNYYTRPVALFAPYWPSSLFTRAHRMYVCVVYCTHAHYKCARDCKTNLFEIP